MSRRNEVAIAQFLDSHDVGDELNVTVHSIVQVAALSAGALSEWTAKRVE